MLTVTAPAKELLRTIDPPRGKILRLERIHGGELGLLAGSPQPDDQVVEESGTVLLCIAGLVSERHDGAELGRVETPNGPQLSIDTPNQPAAVG